MKHKILSVFKIIVLFAAVSALCGFTLSKEYKEIEINVLAKLKLPQWYHEGLYFDGKNIWVNNGEKGNTWIVDTATGSVMKEIKPAGPFTEAITTKNSDTFFVTDWDLENIYTAHIKNDRIIAESEKSLAPAHPAGAIWIDSNLYVVTWTRSLTGTKFNLLKMDDKLNLLNSVQIKNIAEPAHLAWDGKYMWITCWYSRHVYKVDIEKMEILGYFISPVAKATGIAWDGKYLWLTGTFGGLYKIEVKN